MLYKNINKFDTHEFEENVKRRTLKIQNRHNIFLTGKKIFEIPGLLGTLCGCF